MLADSGSRGRARGRPARAAAAAPRGASSKAISSVTSASSAGVAQQPKRRFEAAAIVPARARGDGDDLADLRGDQLQAPAVEGAAEIDRHGLSPYQLISTTVASKPAQPMAVSSPAAVALVWKTTSASLGRALRSAQSERQAPAPIGRRAASTSTSVTSAPGSRAAREREEQADHAGADHHDPVAGTGAGIPDAR